MLLKIIFEDYVSLAPVMDVLSEYLDSEVNPAMANIVVLDRGCSYQLFHIELTEAVVTLMCPCHTHVMPIRELFDAGVQAIKKIQTYVGGSFAMKLWTLKWR